MHVDTAPASATNCIEFRGFHIWKSHQAWSESVREMWPKRKLKNNLCVCVFVVAVIGPCVLDRFFSLITFWMVRYFYASSAACAFRTICSRVDESMNIVCTDRAWQRLCGGGVGHNTTTKWWRWQLYLLRNCSNFMFCARCVCVAALLRLGTLNSTVYGYNLWYYYE